MEVYSKNNVLIIDEAETKDEVFRQISDYAVTLGVASEADKILAGFWKREEMGSTGFEDGFGIPHCRIPEITEPKIIFVKLKNPMRWGTLDGGPITMMFVLMVPDKDGDKHMWYLSLIAKQLMDPEFKEAVRNANDEDELYSIIGDKFNK